MTLDYFEGRETGRALERASKDTAAEAEGTQGWENFAKEMGLE